MWVRPEAYPRVKYLKGASLGYGCKKFYRIGPRFGSIMIEQVMHTWKGDWNLKVKLICLKSSLKWNNSILFIVLIRDFRGQHWKGKRFLMKEIGMISTILYLHISKAFCIEKIKVMCNCLAQCCETGPYSQHFIFFITK